MFASVQLDASNESRLDGCGDAMSIYGIPWRGGFGAPVSSAPGNDFDTFAPCAAAALYRRDMFNLVGGFDERFFCYLEDVDLAFRIRLQGERCVVARKAIVSHVGSAVAGRKSDFTLFHSYRNRIWLVMKNTPGPLLLVVLPLQLLTNLALLCALLVRGRVVPAVRGLFASLSGLNGVFASRKQVQSGRCVRVTALARALAWSPSRVAGRRIHVLRPERTANPSARRQLMPPHGSTR
jgi:GT2 family glycosyltransferase